MSTLAEIVHRAVESVPDPELGGVTIGDLGLVVGVAVSPDGAVMVELTPTFLGCPALGLIAADVQAAVLAAGARSADVRYVHVPIWEPARISERGRRQLAERGIAVPNGSGDVRCPLCGGNALTEAAPVGPTACRSVLWCESCRNVIEMMRGISYAHV